MCSVNIYWVKNSCGQKKFGKRRHRDPSLSGPYRLSLPVGYPTAQHLTAWESCPKDIFRTGWCVCSRRSVHSSVAMRNHSDIVRRTYNTTVQEVSSQIQTKDTRRACSKTIFNLNCHTAIKFVDSWLTTNWDNSQRRAVCHHARRSVKWPTMWIR